MIVHHQRTEHDTTLLIREEAEGEPQEYVEIAVGLSDGLTPVLLSLTPAEARTFADALLSSSQRAEDRRPHGNS